MRKLSLHKPAPIDGQLYQHILLAIKAIIKKHLYKTTAMYVDPVKKQQLFGWHLMLGRGGDSADYFELYDTELFNSRAQVRFLRGEH